jgi:myo-inositol 2-dehydrogenase / D-chiro-inositol 1-dehydrogenase
MSSEIRVGLIGCGRAAELIYLPILTKINNIKVSAVVDPIDSRRKFFSSRINNCLEYETINSDFFEKIDAGIIITPPESHVSIASELLKNNKYVLVEKPLSLSMEGIKELIDTASSSRAELMMGFNHRYWQPVMRLKESLIHVEKINSVKIVFASNYSIWNPISFISDPLDDLAPHFFDLVRFIFNREIRSVSARRVNKNDYQIRVRTDDDISINGRIAYLNKTLKSISVITGYKEYYLTIGSERINPSSGVSRSLLDFYDNLCRKVLGNSSSLKKSYEMQLQLFSRLVESKNQISPGINEGIAAILAGTAARKSINENGKENPVSE